MSSKEKSSTATGDGYVSVPKLRFPEFREADGWALLPMGEIYSFRSNNSLSRDKLNYLSGSIKNIHYGDIHTKFSSHFYINKNLIPFVNKAELGAIRDSSFCNEGDLILADASEDLADIGKCMEITLLNNEKVVAGLHTILARPAKKRVTVGFGGHLFQSVSVRRQIQREAQGAKVLGISPRRLRDIRLPLPSLPEQQKIVSCLDSAGALIAAQGRKVEALRVHKKGLMQQLFPQEGETQPRLRFPEFESAGEWEQKTIGDVSDVLMCKRIFSEETNPIQGVPFYKIGTLGGTPDAFISREIFEEYRSKYKYPRKGEILITCSGTVGKCLPFDGEDSYFQDSNIIWLDNPRGEISNEFLLIVLSNVNWSRLNTTTITRIYSPDLRGLSIRFPKDEAEQQRIADCFTSLGDIVAAETRKLDTLKAHKKGLMQQLFPSVVEG